LGRGDGVRILAPIEPFLGDALALRDELQGQVCGTAGMKRQDRGITHPVAPTARQAELRGLVEGLFRHLPAEDRLLLTLREMEGFSVDEIAAVTKIKPNTVKVRLFRARKRLLEVRRRFFPTARGD